MFIVGFIVGLLTAAILLAVVYAVFLMVQAWGEVICVVDDLGRNPQDIQKGERDE